MKRILTSQAAHINQGFSIVEGVVAVMILAIASVGGLILFTSSIRSTLSSRSENEIQSAISSDLASLLEINRRFTCTGSSDGASTGCRVLPNDPGENDYYSTSSSTYFKGLCDQNGLQYQTVVSGGSTTYMPDGEDQSLVDQILSFINNAARPTSFTTLGITRQPAVPESYTSSPARSGHRYIVTWTMRRNGMSQTIRQVTLTPTVANWCP